MKSRENPPMDYEEIPVLDDAEIADLKKWLDRANELFELAATNGDMKSGLTAISTAVRAFDGLAKQKIRMTKRAVSQAPTGDSVDDIDRIVSTYLSDVALRGKCFHCGAAVGANGFAENPQPGTFPALIEELTKK
jgi:hypothetical protein